MTGERAADVVVIGAGIAGLVAARELRRSGLNTLVLEARDRVGGRTLNQPLAGYVAEAGAQWVGPTQTEVLGLAAELGLETFSTFDDGETVVQFGGKRLAAVGTGPSPATRWLIQKLEAMARDVPLSEPWLAPKADEWDGMSLADWLSAERASQESLFSFELVIAPTLGARTKDISLLWYLFYLHSAGGYDALESIRGGAQDSRIVGGAQAISLRMADEMGDVIHLSTPVSCIDQSGDGLVLETEAGVLKATQVIVAMMPADAARIVFRPSLPAARSALQMQWPDTAKALKVSVAYAAPFWRADGLSGISFSDTAASLTFDNSPRDSSVGILVAFAERAALPADADGREAKIVEALTSVFGERAASPIGFAEQDWAEEPWTTGCVSPVGLGLLTRSGASLRAPVGRIHWAGTETSDVWNGYMDGAVRSGKRAAAEVLVAKRAA